MNVSCFDLNLSYFKLNLTYFNLTRKRYRSGKGHMVLFCDQFQYEVGRYKLVGQSETRQINVCSVASHCYGASKMRLFLVKLLELEETGVAKSTGVLKHRRIQGARGQDPPKALKVLFAPPPTES